MPADLVTRLWLESKGFDQNIGRAIGYLKKMKKESEDSSIQVKGLSGKLSAAGGMVGKVAAGLGIAAGTMEVFDKAMNSNATTQDRFNSYMEAGSRVVDQFFTALYSGDWSVFNSGILQAIDNARQYAVEYTNILRTLDVTAARYERIDAEKNRLESIVEDENRSVAERKAAQAELDRLLIMGIADVREAAQQTEETLRNRLKQYGISDIGNAQMLIEDLYNPNSSKRSNLEEYRNLRSTANQSFNWNVLKYTGEDWYKIQQEASETLYKKYTSEERSYYDSLLRLVDSLTKEEYDSLKELFDRRSDLVDKAGTWEKDRTGARDEILSAITGTSTGEKPEVIPSGSILELQKKIASLREDFQKATNDGIRAGLQTSISEFETQLRMMQERAKGTAVVSGMSAVSGRDIKSDIASGYIDVEGVKMQTAANYDYADSLQTISSIMGSITNLTNEGAGAWISYAANVMMAVAQAIPQIQALTGAELRLAGVKAISSAAEMPLIGWLQVGAAAAAVVAAMASIPKFANGGIVPGISYAGDRVPALVNSGEMILNRGQQANLFRMIAAGRETTQKIEITGVLRGSGRDLLAVIGNQERFNKRTR